MLLSLFTPPVQESVSVNAIFICWLEYQFIFDSAKFLIVSNCNPVQLSSQSMFRISLADALLQNQHESPLSKL